MFPRVWTLDPMSFFPVCSGPDIIYNANAKNVWGGRGTLFPFTCRQLQCESRISVFAFFAFIAVLQAIELLAHILLRAEEFRKYLLKRDSPARASGSWRSMFVFSEY